MELNIVKKIKGNCNEKGIGEAFQEIEDHFKNIYKILETHYPEEFSTTKQVKKEEGQEWWTGKKNT